jgi:hypothetical protein
MKVALNIRFGSLKDTLPPIGFAAVRHPTPISQPVSRSLSHAAVGVHASAGAFGFLDRPGASPSSGEDCHLGHTAAATPASGVSQLQLCIQQPALRIACLLNRSIGRHAASHAVGIASSNSTTGCSGRGHHMRLGRCWYKDASNSA